MLSNAQLDRSFWAKALEYASHLMNGLSSTSIGDKTPLDIWSGGSAQDYGLSKKFIILGIKRNMKGYNLWDPENKKIVLSKHVTFNEILLLKSIISQQVERLKTKDVSQRVEVDATPPPLIDSVSVGISPGGDHVA